MANKKTQKKRAKVAASKTQVVAVVVRCSGASIDFVGLRSRLADPIRQSLREAGGREAVPKLPIAPYQYRYTFPDAKAATTVFNEMFNEGAHHIDAVADLADAQWVSDEMDRLAASLQ